MNLPDQPNPKRLLAAACAGDRDAREQLLEFYRAYLNLLARLEIARRWKGKADPDDLVQETIREVRRNFDPCRATNEKAFLRWLRQVLLSTLAKRMRCGLETQDVVAWLENTLTERLEESSAMLDQGLFARQGAPGQRAVSREPVVLLADALERLPDADREVIILRHLEGLTFPQVAGRMGRTVESIKRLWALALARLRRLLREAF